MYLSDYFWARWEAKGNRAEINELMDMNKKEREREWREKATLIHVPFIHKDIHTVWLSLSQEQNRVHSTNGVRTRFSHIFFILSFFLSFFDIVHVMSLIDLRSRPDHFTTTLTFLFSFSLIRTLHGSWIRSLVLFISAIKDTKKPFVLDLVYFRYVDLIAYLAS